MDASMQTDERMTADGEGVWSWHPWAGAKSAMMIAGDGHGHRGERAESRKPLRREGRVVRLEPVVTMLVCFHLLHARLRVRPAPGFPCALCLRGTNHPQDSGEIAPRERRPMFFDAVIASSLPLLAMTKH
jgi:hypothetical protein